MAAEVRAARRRFTVSAVSGVRPTVPRVAASHPVHRITDPCRPGDLLVSCLGRSAFPTAAARGPAADETIKQPRANDTDALRVCVCPNVAGGSFWLPPGYNPCISEYYGLVLT